MTKTANQKMKEISVALSSARAQTKLKIPKCASAC